MCPARCRGRISSSSPAASSYSRIVYGYPLTQPRAAELAPEDLTKSTLPGVPAPPISGRKTAVAARPGLRPQNTDGTRIAAADTIHCELRYSKSARQAEVGTIRAAIADSHPDKRKPAK